MYRVVKFKYSNRAVRSRLSYRVVTSRCSITVVCIRTDAKHENVLQELQQDNKSKTATLFAKEEEVASLKAVVEKLKAERQKLQIQVREYCYLLKPPSLELVALPLM